MPRMGRVSACWSPHYRVRERQIKRCCSANVAMCHNEDSQLLRTYIKARLRLLLVLPVHTVPSAFPVTSCPFPSSLPCHFLPTPPPESPRYFLILFPDCLSSLSVGIRSFTHGFRLFLRMPYCVAQWETPVDPYMRIVAEKTSRFLLIA